MPVEQIEEIMALYKTTRQEKDTKARQQNLRALFDQQINVLKDRNCPDQIVEMLTNQKGQVINKAAKMNISKGNIPFLPVIPTTYLTIYSQMAMVKHQDKFGINLLDPAEITNQLETPLKPYFIFDAEDGQATLGKSPAKAEKLIKEQERRCLTEVEVIALCIQTDVLSRHYVNATAARYESDDGVPHLYLDDDRPKLYWNYVDGPHGRWGSASCGK